MFLFYFLQGTITYPFRVEIGHQSSNPWSSQPNSPIHLGETCQTPFIPQREGTAFSLII